jgi:hypothetical protein
VIVNNTFIHQYNFNTSRISNVHGSAVWAHDPAYRAGVPYANAALNNQYRGNVRQNVAPRAIPEAGRNMPAQQGQRFGGRQIPNSAPPVQNRSVFGGMNSGRAAQTNAEHGYSSMGPSRSAPSRSAPAPRAAPAPRSAPSGGERRK